MSWNKARNWYLAADSGSMVKNRSSTDVFFYYIWVIIHRRSLVVGPLPTAIVDKNCVRFVPGLRGGSSEKPQTVCPMNRGGLRGFRSKIYRSSLVPNGRGTAAWRFQQDWSINCLIILSQKSRANQEFAEKLKRKTNKKERLMSDETRSIRVIPFSGTLKSE